VTENWLPGRVTEFSRRHRRPDVDNQHDTEGASLAELRLLD